MWTEQLVQGAGMAGSTKGQGRPYHAGPWDYTAELDFSPGVMGNHGRVLNWGWQG